MAHGARSAPPTTTPPRQVSRLSEHAVTAADAAVGASAALAGTTQHMRGDVARPHGEVEPLLAVGHGPRSALVRDPARFLDQHVLGKDEVVPDLLR